MASSCLMSENVIHHVIKKISMTKFKYNLRNLVQNKVLSLSIKSEQKKVMAYIIIIQKKEADSWYII